MLQPAESLHCYICAVRKPLQAAGTSHTRLGLTHLFCRGAHNAMENLPRTGEAVGGESGGTHAVGIKQCNMTAIPASRLICRVACKRQAWF